MKFSEAMEAMQKGAKVTRLPYIKNIYFLLDGNKVKSFHPEIKVFSYTENIMISDGWIVIGEPGEFKFYDIIPFLQKGMIAKLKEWIDSYIEYDHSNKCLILFAMEEFSYIPDFESFIAEDWIIVG